jgi:hypothetical protein
LVSVAKKTYLVIGGDSTDRGKIIQDIKSKIFGSKLNSLSTFTFYPHQIKLEELKKLLFNFGFASNRLVVFKEVDKLSSEVKEFILNNLSDVTSHNYFIFESPQNYFILTHSYKYTRDQFFKYLLKVSSVRKIDDFKEVVSINRIIKAVNKKNLPQAYYFLEKIFAQYPKKDNSLGIKILATMMRRLSFPEAKQNKMLAAIWQAEKKIKDGLLDSKTALNLLILKIISR